MAAAVGGGAPTSPAFDMRMVAAGLPDPHTGLHPVTLASAEAGALAHDLQCFVAVLIPRSGPPEKQIEGYEVSCQLAAFVRSGREPLRNKHASALLFVAVLSHFTSLKAGACTLRHAYDITFKPYLYHNRLCSSAASGYHRRA